MRNTLATAALLLALSCPALAGEMPNPGPTEPPAAAADGIIHTGSPEAADGIIHTGLAAALSVLAGVLPLL